MSDLSPYCAPNRTLTRRRSPGSGNPLIRKWNGPGSGFSGQGRPILPWTGASKAAHGGKDNRNSTFLALQFKG